MDPEDLREIISAYQKCVAETVRRFCGSVANYMGDGVLVYFGYPQAHEDDAERAVRAGLQLITALNELKTSVSLQIRVGIATGLVVVGDLIGSGEAQESGIVGETPNLAARVQGVAQPNTVVIAEGTRKLLGNLFELEDLGAKDLKGISRLVRAWAVLREASVEGRFEALHTSGLMPLVGREEELELLLRRWSRAKNGEGQVVLISGEAGIGKSRLTAELLERLAKEPHTRLRNFCSPQHTDSALHPIITSWNVPPDLCTMTLRTLSLTSSTRCLGTVRHRLKTQHSLRRCSHCQTTLAIRRSNYHRRSAGKERSLRSFHKSWPSHAKIRF
jgi:class 3 adenylate cyclase